MFWSEPCIPFCPSGRRLCALPYTSTLAYISFLSVFHWLPGFLTRANHLGCIAHFQLTLWLLLFVNYFTFLLVVFYDTALFCSNQQNGTRVTFLLVQTKESFFPAHYGWGFSCSWDSPLCHLQHHQQQLRRQFPACSLLLQSLMWGERKGVGAYLLSCFR